MDTLRGAEHLNICRNMIDIMIKGEAHRDIFYWHGLQIRGVRKNQKS